MNRIESIKERINHNKGKQSYPELVKESFIERFGMNEHDATVVAYAPDDVEYLLQRLERYETLLNKAKDKSQILASHCAYSMDARYSLDVRDTFEKTQAIYELFRDGLEDEQP